MSLRRLKPSSSRACSHAARMCSRVDDDRRLAERLRRRDVTRDLREVAHVATCLRSYAGGTPARCASCRRMIPSISASGRGGQNGHVDVDGDDAVDALQDRVVVEHAARARARAHRDHPLRLEHLVVDLPQRRRHLVRDAARTRSAGRPGAATSGTPPCRSARGRSASRRSTSSRSRSRRARTCRATSTSSAPSAPPCRASSCRAPARAPRRRAPPRTGTGPFVGQSSRSDWRP